VSNIEDFLKNTAYGYLVCTGKVATINNRKKAECECQCGKIKYYKTDSLIRGATKSCGCKKGEMTGNGIRKHGLSRSENGKKHSLYSIWTGMKYRCYTVSNESYHNYGGRGITVSIDWKDSFNNFYEWAINNGWEKGLTLERKENNGNYEANNCCWITRGKQQSNKRVTKKIEAFGEIKCVQEWSRDKRCKISTTTLHDRIFKRNWNIEKAIITPSCKKITSVH